MTPFRPVQNILVMVVFLSIGLLADLGFIADNLGAVLFLALMICLVKTAVNVTILRILGQNWRDAGIAGLSLSQLGEFSIILAGAAFMAGAAGPSELKLIIAVIALSLVVGPLWMAAARRLRHIAGGDNLSLGEISASAFGDDLASLRRNLVLVGHGEFRAIADDMRARRRHKSAPLPAPQPAPQPANDDEDAPSQENIDPAPEQDTAETIAAIGAGVRAARFGAVRKNGTENPNR
jgi:CPA2 family monovalent cation:H+ antiporter-2